MVLIDEPPVEMMSEGLNEVSRSAVLEDEEVLDVLQEFLLKGDTDGTSYSFKAKIYSLDVSGTFVVSPGFVNVQGCTLTIGEFPEDRVADLITGNFSALTILMNGFKVELHSGKTNRISYTAEAGGRCSLIWDLNFAQIVKLGLSK